MFKQEVILKNGPGLYARSADLFVKEVSKFLSEINVLREEKEYNAKSIMGILSMGLGKGDVILIQAEGNDAEKAVKALIKLVNNNFNE